MTARSRFVVALVATTLGAASSSCGDGGGEAIPLPDYQRRANAICGPAIEEMNSVVEPVIEATLASMGTEPFEPPELQGFYRALEEPTDAAGAIIDHMLDSLRELPSPDERAEDYAQVWDDIETTMDHARADIAEAGDYPDAAVVLWDIDTSPFNAIDARADQLGVPACALDT
jgi:hypothetical protein